MSKKRTKRSTANVNDEPIVLGTQLAAAQQAERARLKTGGKTASPLPRGRYRESSSELGLVRPKLEPYDLALRAFAQRFAASDPDARAQMRAAIGMNQLYTLLTFGQRAAVFALREWDEAWVRDGLAAVAAIELERIDWRDIFFPMCLLYHSAKRVGAKAARLFRTTAALAEPAVANQLRDYLKGSADDRNISEMGYQEIQTSVGIGFIESGFGSDSPRTHLTELALAIGDCLAKDKYSPSVEIADELPSVWLEGVDDAKLNRALKKVRAGASVSGDLRARYSPHHADQMLVIFLVELRDTASAEALLDLARGKRDRDTCLLGVRSGTLFALVVARSYVKGVKTYETKTSIRRFEEPLQKLLDRYAAR